MPARSMLRLRMEVITAAVAWVLTSAGQNVPAALNWLEVLSPRHTVNLTGLGAKLSPTAKIYYPGSEGFEEASTRWSVLDEPRVNVVVVPGTEDDVAETVIAFSCRVPRTQGGLISVAQMTMSMNC
jgi:hypothetical protein